MAKKISQLKAVVGVPSCVTSTLGAMRPEGLFLGSLEHSIRIFHTDPRHAVHPKALLQWDTLALYTGGLGGCSRFWPFQWIEGGYLLGLSALLIAATIWLVRHRAA